jgi:hypothetical protein
MYRFIFHGIPCECETADELRSIVASNGQAKRPYKRRKATKTSRNGVKASWDAAKRVAKKLGRSDVSQVRSDLKAGTIKGE